MLVMQAVSGEPAGATLGLELGSPQVLPSDCWPRTGAVLVVGRRRESTFGRLGAWTWGTVGWRKG